MHQASHVHFAVIKLKGLNPALPLLAAFEYSCPWFLFVCSCFVRERIQLHTLSPLRLLSVYCFVLFWTVRGRSAQILVWSCWILCTEDVFFPHHLHIFTSSWLHFLPVATALLHDSEFRIIFLFFSFFLMLLSCAVKHKPGMNLQTGKKETAATPVWPSTPLADSIIRAQHFLK